MLSYQGMIYSGGLRPKSTKMDSVYFSFLVWHIAVLVGIFNVARHCMHVSLGSLWGSTTIDSNN